MCVLCACDLSRYIKLNDYDSTFSFTGEGCSHKYTEHLNHFPNCNPYANGVMKLECTIEVPPNTTEITIGWNLNCRQLMNDSSVSIWIQQQVSSEVRRVRSQLTISDLTDDYVGEYTCNRKCEVCTQ